MSFQIKYFDVLHKVDEEYFQRFCPDNKKNVYAFSRFKK